MGCLLAPDKPWSTWRRVTPAVLHREATIVSLSMACFAGEAAASDHWGIAAQFYAEAASSHPGGLVTGQVALADVIARYSWIFGDARPHAVYRVFGRNLPDQMSSMGALWSMADRASRRYWETLEDGDRDESGALGLSPFTGKAVRIPLRWDRVDRDEPQAG